MMNLQLRLAEKADAMTIYNWANDPLVRSVSFSSAAIPLDRHINWFAKKLSSEQCVYLILMADNVPAGQIRYEITGDVYLISYSIDAGFRKKGLGTAVLALGEQYIRSRSTDNAIVLVGYVKNDNVPSIVSFQRNGYTQETATEQTYPDSFKFTKHIG